MGQNVPNSSCHFSKHKSVSAQILHHSSVIKYNYSISFWLKHNTLSTKVTHQSANFYTCHCLHKNSPNSSCHFWDQKSVSLQTLHHSSVSWDVTLLCTFHLKLHMVWTKRAHQSANFQTFDCSSCFKSRVNFLSNFASPFSVMKHNTYEIFYLKHYVLDKRSTSKYIFRLLSALSSPNSSCYFWKHKFRIYSSFESLFSIMKDNTCILWTKRAHQKDISRLLSGWVKIHIWSHGLLF